MREEKQMHVHAFVFGQVYHITLAFSGVIIISD